MYTVTLKEALEEKGKSMYWLTQTTGIAQSTINRLTNKKTKRIDFEVLEKICLALECQPDKIIRIEKTHDDV
jgi:putative transcriptional regulator